MKTQIRRGVFETNSSSTHSICISKKAVKIDKNKTIYFKLGDYGWSNGIANAANYLYTAIMCQRERYELLDRLKSILDKHNIKYDFQEAIVHSMEYNGVKYSFLKNGGIDHSDATMPFITAVLDNEDMLMRLLFGESHVYTGCDNDDYDPEYKDVARTELYSSEAKGMVKNEYHDEENYDYFFKGN